MTFEQRLINLVREYEILYNPEHPNYNKTQLRTVAWKEIAEKLDSNRHMCKKKWKSLRDTYKKLLIKIEAAGGVYKYHRRKWQYLSLISFVNKYDPIFQKHKGTDWPTFVDTSKQEIMIYQDKINTEFSEDEEEKESPNVEETINKTCIEEVECVEDTVDPIYYCTQEEYLALEETCSSPVDVPEGVKVVEITHSYAKTFKVEENAAENVTENTEEYIEGTPTEYAENGCKGLKDPNVTATIAGPCSYYLAQLGAQIDALPVPSDIQLNLEKRIKNLVDEVVEEYSRQLHAGIAS